MISLILISIASILNAAMDVVSHHYHDSFFSLLDNDNYFNPKKSWKNKYVNGDVSQGRKKFLGVTIHVSFTDFWHLCKSLMIVLICISIAVSNPIFLFPLQKTVWIIELMNIITHVFIYGVAWNVMFSLFYNKVLRLKK